MFKSISDCSQMYYIADPFLPMPRNRRSNNTAVRMNYAAQRLENRKFRGQANLQKEIIGKDSESATCDRLENFRQILKKKFFLFFFVKLITDNFLSPSKLFVFNNQNFFRITEKVKICKKKLKKVFFLQFFLSIVRFLIICYQ